MSDWLWWVVSGAVVCGLCALGFWALEPDEDGEPDDGLADPDGGVDVGAADLLVAAGPRPPMSAGETLGLMVLVASGMVAALALAGFGVFWVAVRPFLRWLW